MIGPKKRPEESRAPTEMCRTMLEKNSSKSLNLLFKVECAKSHIIHMEKIRFWGSPIAFLWLYLGRVRERFFAIYWAEGVLSGI